MKIWIETRLIEPPEFTVTGKFGASLMFVGYFKLTQQWFWLQPNGVVERIAEPPLLWVEQAYVNKHTLATPRARRDAPHHIHEKRSEQLLLAV
jgi:hypothetical protein